ncbi:MAG TPA: phosphotransferase, partial [Acidimicrobiia bacterium]|nr:phosphotransferase [Acidimicrobiia bacterium]
DPKVLFLRSDGHWTLPRVRLKGDVWAGNADVLVPAFAKRLGSRPWIYRQIRIAADRETKRIEGIFEMIMTSSGWEPPRNSRWVDRSSLETLRVKEERFRLLVDRYLSDLERGEVPTERPPWCADGWLSGVRSWIEEELTRLGHVLLDLEQVKQWSISSVLRVKTDGPDFYFKASIDVPLFVNEAVVTDRLSRRFPAYIPGPIAVDPARAWMLLPDFGELVPETSGVEVRRQLFERFCELQRASANWIMDLLADGCIDRRLHVLESQIDPLLNDEGAMSAITEHERDRLRTLAPALKELTREMANLDVPYTLVHSDLHLANTARVDGVLTFFDWTDACVAHPFVDLMALKFETDDNEKQSIMDAYLAGWHEVATPEALQRAVLLASVLIPLHHAVSYQQLLVNLEPAARPELDATGGFLRRVIASADALKAE